MQTFVLSAISRNEKKMKILHLRIYLMRARKRWTKFKGEETKIEFFFV